MLDSYKYRYKSIYNFIYNYRYKKTNSDTNTVKVKETNTEDQKSNFARKVFLQILVKIQIQIGMKIQRKK